MYQEQEPPFAEPGPKATFSVSVESFDTSTFYQDVVNAVVDRILGKNWSESSIEKRVSEAVQAKAMARLDEALDASVDELLTRPIQKFDTFGRPVGDAISIESVIRDGAQTFLTEMVDSNGKPTRDSYGTRKTRIEWHVEQNVINGLAKEIKAEAEAVRTEVVRKAQAAAAALLASMK